MDNSEIQDKVLRMNQIDVNDLWAREWSNAYAFFNSKGNIKTRSRLKAKWNKDFKEMLFELEKTIVAGLQDKVQE